MGDTGRQAKRRSRTGIMNFSIGHWIGAGVLDAVLRVLYILAATLNPLLIPFALEYTAIHLGCLIPTALLAKLLGLRGRITAVSVLVIANVLFCGIFALSWVTSIKRGRQSSCVGYNFKCDWID